MQCNFLVDNLSQWLSLVWPTMMQSSNAWGYTVQNMHAQVLSVGPKPTDLIWALRRMGYYIFYVHEKGWLVVSNVALVRYDLSIPRKWACYLQRLEVLYRDMSPQFYWGEAHLGRRWSKESKSQDPNWVGDCIELQWAKLGSNMSWAYHHINRKNTWDSLSMPSEFLIVCFTLFTKRETNLCVLLHAENIWQWVQLLYDWN